MIQSYVELKRQLFSLVERESCGNEVVALLLPNNKGRDTEDSMWDYKENLPEYPLTAGTPATERQEHAVRVGRLLRGIVAFHNSYGGYIVAGVSNSTRYLVGFDGVIDTDKLRQRIKGETAREIPIVYERLAVSRPMGSDITVGLLLIPRRQDHVDPVQFKRDGPQSADGRLTYKKNGIYLRRDHESRRQDGIEDMKFLLVPNRRRFDPPTSVTTTSILDHNSIFLDKTITKMVPRDEYIAKLWAWLTEKLNAVKLLSGTGGVGKSTIAGAFAREVVQESPIGFQKVIWLSAKTKFLRPFDGGEVTADPDDEAERPKYRDVDTMLLALLSELGYVEEDIDKDDDTEDLMEKTIEALHITPSFVVIDDVDSLDGDEQYALFQTVASIFGRTLSQTGASSRALLTARTTLGTAKRQRIEVKGFPLEAFTEYVSGLCVEYELAFNPYAHPKIIRRFHTVSNGSPLFAAAIVSLVTNHVAPNIPSAVERFQGYDGEDVREFAYQREIESLSETQLRTLYAVIELEETSLPELQVVTESSSRRLSSDLTMLMEHHLIAFATGAPGPDEVYAAPESLRLMRNVIRKTLRNVAAIDRACGNVRSEVKRYGIDAGRVVNRVVAHWQAGETAQALEVAIWGDRQAKGKHPDIKCILGRAYLRVEPPKPNLSDAALRAANELGCKRDELFALWIEAKRMLEDWSGVVEITRMADRQAASANNVYYRAVAYSELGANAVRTGNLAEAANLLREGAREIAAAFAQGRARGRVPELRELGVALYVEYVEFLARSAIPEKAIEVWDAVCEAFDSHCRKSFLFRIGLVALQQWFDNVEFVRERAHPNTLAKIEEVLNSLVTYRRRLIDIEWPDDSLFEEMERTHRNLRDRAIRMKDAVAAGF